MNRDSSPPSPPPSKEEKVCRPTEKGFRPLSRASYSKAKPVHKMSARKASPNRGSSSSPYARKCPRRERTRASSSSSDDAYSDDTFTSCPSTPSPKKDVFQLGKCGACHKDLESHSKRIITEKDKEMIKKICEMMNKPLIIPGIELWEPKLKATTAVANTAGNTTEVESSIASNAAHTTSPVSSETSSEVDKLKECSMATKADAQSVKGSIEENFSSNAGALYEESESAISRETGTTAEHSGALSNDKENTAGKDSNGKSTKRKKCSYDRSGNDRKAKQSTSDVASRLKNDTANVSTETGSGRIKKIARKRSAGISCTPIPNTSNDAESTEGKFITKTIPTPSDGKVTPVGTPQKPIKILKKDDQAIPVQKYASTMYPENDGPSAKPSGGFWDFEDIPKHNYDNHFKTAKQFDMEDGNDPAAYMKQYRGQQNLYMEPDYDGNSEMTDDQADMYTYIFNGKKYATIPKGPPFSFNCSNLSPTFGRRMSSEVFGGMKRKNLHDTSDYCLDASFPTNKFNFGMPKPNPHCSSNEYLNRDLPPNWGKPRQNPFGMIGQHLNQKFTPLPSKLAEDFRKIYKIDDSLKSKLPEELINEKVGPENVPTKGEGIMLEDEVLIEYEEDDGSSFDEIVMEDMKAGIAAFKERHVEPVSHRSEANATKELGFILAPPNSPREPLPEHTSAVDEVLEAEDGWSMPQAKHGDDVAYLAHSNEAIDLSNPNIKFVFEGGIVIEADDTASE